MIWQIKILIILGLIMVGIYTISYFKLFRNKEYRIFLWGMIALTLPFYLIGWAYFIVGELIY